MHVRVGLPVVGGRAEKSTANGMLETGKMHRYRMLRGFQRRIAEPTEAKVYVRRSKLLSCANSEPTSPA